MQVLKTTSPSDCTASPPRSPISVKPSSSTSATPSANRHLSVNEFALRDGCHDHTGQFPAGEWRVVTKTVKGFGVDHPPLTGIEKHPVVLIAHLQNVGWALDTGAMDDSPRKPQAQHDAQRSFEAVKSDCALRFGPRLVWSVIRGDHVDRPVKQPFNDRSSIGRTAQWRVDGRLRSQMGDLVAGERKMMRSRLSGEMQPFTLCIADELNSLSGAYMLEMQTRLWSMPQRLYCVPGRPRLVVSRSLRRLILRVHQDGQPRSCRLRQATLQDGRRHRVPAIVREGDGPSRFQRVRVGQLPPI